MKRSGGRETRCVPGSLRAGSDRRSEGTDYVHAANDKSHVPARQAIRSTHDNQQEIRH